VLLPLIELLVIPACGRVAYHAECERLVLIAPLLPVHHALVKHAHGVSVLILICQHVFEQFLSRCQCGFLGLSPGLLDQIEGHFLYLVIQEPALLSLVGLLDEVLEDLVLELRDQGLVDLEVDEAVAEVSLETVGHLDEVSGFCELLLLDFQNSLEEVVI